MDNPEFIIAIILMFVLFCMGGCLGASVGQHSMEKQAIEKGFAHHNYTNGVWEWNTTTNK